MKNFVDYYRVLGLGSHANGPEIRAAYVRLAKEHHPDKGGDPKKMNLVNDAYDTLKNPVSRAQFDRRRTELRAPVIRASQAQSSRPVYQPVKARKIGKAWLPIFCLLLLTIAVWFLLSPTRQKDNNLNSPSEQEQKQGELNNIKAQYDACIESFDQITSRLAQVNHEMNVAKSNNDTAGHNALIPTQNQIVADYNAKRAECNLLKNQYNERVSNFNESTLP